MFPSGFRTALPSGDAGDGGGYDGTGDSVMDQQGSSNSL